MSILGASSLHAFLTILAASLLAIEEDTIASCFVPDCWVGTISVLRALTLKFVRLVPIPLAELPNQLPGHHRSEFDAERKLDTIVRTPRGLTSQSRISEHGTCVCGSPWNDH